jgi:phosphomannomutase
MSERTLTAFKAYDLRGRLGEDMDEDVAYRLGPRRRGTIRGQVRRDWMGRAGHKCRPRGRRRARRDWKAGAHAWTIGLAGTEEMYCATAELGACLGIEVTASHNPIDYNGMKLVAAGARPLDPGTDFQKLRRRAEAAAWRRADRLGEALDKSAEARRRYVEKVLSFIDIETLTPLKILINSGNGAAGPTFDAIADALAARGAPLTFTRHHHEPDPSFPNGIPNPLLPENHAATAGAVRAAGADFGVAFDGDFDRCFLFDERGDFVPGEYLVGLLAETFLARAPGAAIVHDPRVIWSTEAAIAAGGGRGGLRQDGPRLHQGRHARA